MQGIGQARRLILGAMFLAAGAIADAEVIRPRDRERFEDEFRRTPRVSARANSTDRRMPAAFRAYLEGGPRLWAKVVPTVPAGLRLRVDSSGMLPDTSLVRFLRWRRDRNAVRFDRFHPRVGPMLREDEIARTPLPPPRVELPPPLTPPSPLLLPDVNVNVPEPSAWLSGLTIAGLAMLTRRRSRSTQGTRAT